MESQKEEIEERKKGGEKQRTVIGKGIRYRAGGCRELEGKGGGR